MPDDILPAEIMLIAPADAEAAGFLPQLEIALKAVEVAALVLPRGQRSETAYKNFVKAIASKVQAAGTAVLVEGEPGLVRMLGVDGLHVSTGHADLKTAISALRPDYIVGAGGIASRHDAMSKGELGPDYLFFGPLSGPRDPEQREMARWWAEIMTVPAVLSDPAAKPETAASEGCEFIAFGDSIWSAPDVGAALKALAATLPVAA